MSSTHFASFGNFTGCSRFGSISARTWSHDFRTREHALPRQDLGVLDALRELALVLRREQLVLGQLTEVRREVIVGVRGAHRRRAALHRRLSTSAAIGTGSRRERATAHSDRCSRAILSRDRERARRAYVVRRVVGAAGDELNEWWPWRLLLIPGETTLDSNRCISVRDSLHGTYERGRMPVICARCAPKLGAATSHPAR